MADILEKYPSLKKFENESYVEVWVCIHPSQTKTVINGLCALKINHFPPIL